MQINRYHCLNEQQNNTQWRMCSAAMMAVAYALTERFIVEITVAPSDTVNADKDLQNSAGSATCSITWSENDQIGHKVVSNFHKLEQTICSFFTRKTVHMHGYIYTIQLYGWMRSKGVSTSEAITASNFLCSSTSFSVHSIIFMQ